MNFNSIFSILKTYTRGHKAKSTIYKFCAFLIKHSSILPTLLKLQPKVCTITNLTSFFVYILNKIFTNTKTVVNFKSVFSHFYRLNMGAVAKSTTCQFLWDLPKHTLIVMPSENLTLNMNYNVSVKLYLKRKISNKQILLTLRIIFPIVVKLTQ